MGKLPAVAFCLALNLEGLVELSLLRGSGGASSAVAAIEAVSSNSCMLNLGYSSRALFLRNMAS